MWYTNLRRTFTTLAFRLWTLAGCGICSRPMLSLITWVPNFSFLEFYHLVISIANMYLHLTSLYAVWTPVCWSVIRKSTGYSFLFPTGFDFCISFLILSEFATFDWTTYILIIHVFMWNYSRVRRTRKFVSTASHSNKNIALERENPEG